MIPRISNIMWRKLILTSLALALFLASSCAPVWGGEDPCSSLSKMRQRYDKQTYISLEFKQFTYSEIFESIDSLVGTLQADGSGKYRLSLSDNLGLFQELVCDGNSLWSYSVENKQAILSNVTDLNSWNPVTLLYDRDAVYECVEEKLIGPKRETIVFNMCARDSGSIPQSFILKVSKDDYVPQEIVYFDDNNSRIDIRIFDFVRPEKLPDSLFRFLPPLGVEVIEMP